jgi:hypothetical protein
MLVTIMRSATDTNYSQPTPEILTAWIKFHLEKIKISYIFLFLQGDTSTGLIHTAHHFTQCLRNIDQTLLNYISFHVEITGYTSKIRENVIYRQGKTVCMTMTCNQLSKMVWVGIERPMDSIRNDRRNIPLFDPEHALKRPNYGIGTSFKKIMRLC